MEFEALIMLIIRDVYQINGFSLYAESSKLKGYAKSVKSGGWPECDIHIVNHQKSPAAATECAVFVFRIEVPDFLHRFSLG